MCELTPRASSGTSPGRPPLRADAARNRERIVTAARELFARRGLDVPMDEVARSAGVGTATLYRRFPTRSALIAAVFEDRMAAFAKATAQALADPDPWGAFCRFVERICAMQAADLGFADVLTLTFPTADVLKEMRAQGSRGFAELVARAKASGGLRADFTHEDIVLVLIANAGVIDATRDAAPEAWHRLVGYLLQAFSAEHTRPLPPSPGPTAINDVMLQLARRAQT
jgi:AcrR family transcriptional regulator